jgi:cyanophycinase
MNAVLVKAGTLNSVTTFVIRAREATSDPSVVAAVKAAELLWFAGGDQWNYVRMWKGTPLGAAIQERIAAGVPVGGSSAGLAIMGEHGFSAEFDTVRSPEALKHPFDRRVAIESKFLKIPLLAGIITDTHFAKRDRMGRLLAFLARLRGKASAIAVDEGSAVMLEADGWASVSGDGHAYFLRPARAPEVCAPDMPLTFADVKVYRIASNGRFNVKSWKGDSGLAYELSVREGVISSSQEGGAVY